MAVTGTKTFQNYIGGEWVGSASGETFESVSPATGDRIGVFPRSGAEDVDRAVEAAKAAFEEWRLVPAPKRGEILYRFADLLTDEKDELTDLMAHETAFHRRTPPGRGWDRLRRRCLPYVILRVSAMARSQA